MKPTDSSSGNASEQPVPTSASSRVKPKKSASAPSGAVARPSGRAPFPKKKAVSSKQKAASKKKAAGKMPALPAPAGQSKTPPIAASAADTTANPAPDTQHPTPALGPNGHPLYSISKLAELFEMDRSVVRRRLQAAKIRPVDKKEKKTIYELTPEVEELLGETGSQRLDEVNLRKAEADARLKEIKVDRESRHLVPYEEAQEEWQEILKWLYQQLVIENPRRNAARYRKCKTTGEITAALKRDSAKPFQDLRANYAQIFKQRGGKS